MDNHLAGDDDDEHQLGHVHLNDEVDDDEEPITAQQVMRYHSRAKHLYHIGKTNL